MAQEGFYQRIARQKTEISAQLQAWLNDEITVEEYEALCERRRAVEEEENNRPWKALEDALCSADLEKVRLLATPEMIAETNRQRVPLLIQPSYAGDEKVVAFLIAQGVDPNVPGHDNLTALSCAAMKDEAKIFKMLLAAGADVNVKTVQGDSIRQLAGYNGADAVLRVLGNKALMQQLTVERVLSKPRGPSLG